MKIIIKSILSVALLAIMSNSFAIDAKYSELEKNLKSNLPDLVVDQISPTQVAGVYEVDSGRKVIYVDASGNYAFVGNLLDLKNKTNLTEDRTKSLNKIDFAKLPLSIAIRKIVGNGKDKIAVFTDPDCPFCRRLEVETLSKLKNVTIYYFFYPLAIHSNAATISKQILCSENPQFAMESYMVATKIPNRNDKCDNAKKLIQMQDAANNLVQVNVTPTLILPNGKIVSGLIPEDYLSNLIKSNKAESGL